MPGVVYGFFQDRFFADNCDQFRRLMQLGLRRRRWTLFKIGTIFIPLTVIIIGAQVLRSAEAALRLRCVVAALRIAIMQACIRLTDRLSLLFGATNHGGRVLVVRTSIMLMGVLASFVPRDRCCWLIARLRPTRVVRGRILRRRCRVRRWRVPP